MRALVGRLPLVKLEDVDRTEAWFLRHGVKAVFFGRMIPIFRSLVSIPAGVERMPVPVFLLFTTLGSLIWNSTFVLAGYLLGENWHVVEAYVGTLQNVVIVARVGAVGWFVVSRIRRARRPGPPAEPRRGTVYRGLAAALAARDLGPVSGSCVDSSAGWNAMAVPGAGIPP